MGTCVEDGSGTCCCLHAMCLVPIVRQTLLHGASVVLGHFSIRVCTCHCQVSLCISLCAVHDFLQNCCEGIRRGHLPARPGAACGNMLWHSRFIASQHGHEAGRQQGVKKERTASFSSSIYDSQNACVVLIVRTARALVYAYAHARLCACLSSCEATSSLLTPDLLRREQTREPVWTGDW